MRPRSLRSIGSGSCSIREALSRSRREECVPEVIRVCLIGDHDTAALRGEVPAIVTALIRAAVRQA